MSKTRLCVECKAELEPNEKFCHNCGAEQKQEKEETLFGEGSRANIMGSVNRTTNTTNNVDSSHTDNSSTVNNSTTYIMKNKVEFCEICGNSLEEKHARCPKCGKEICFDCRVPGKNRCVECEQKAENDYRAAFQDLVMSTNGHIGVAGEKVMAQKARELNIVDKKASIEKDIMGIYRPVGVASAAHVSPAPVEVKSPVVESVSANTANVAQSGVRESVQEPQQKKSNNMWIIISVVALLVIGGVGALIFTNNDKPQDTVPAKEAASVQTAGKAADVKKESSASTLQPEASKPAAEVKPAATQQPAASTSSAAAKPSSSTGSSGVKATTATAAKLQEAEAKPVVKDEDYENGMKAYQAADGAKALDYFKKSGSAESLYMIGVIYEKGCGSIGKNDLMARQNFKKAAAKGSEQAKSKL